MTYVTRSFAFTEDESVCLANLRTLSAQGGGDGPEAVAAALKATLDMPWREDATKISVLIADAPPHGLGESGDGFPNGDPDGVDPLSVLDQMSARGITIYSVGCQPALSHYRFAVDFFIACAERTNGQSVSLGSASALADVIMGSAIEEVELERLAQELELDVAQWRSASPEMDDEAVQRAVHQQWQERGRRTRQSKTAKLSSPTACFVSEARSLSAAKAKLAECAPPLGSRTLASSRAAPAESRSLMRSLSAAPSEPLDERVRIEEDAVSYEQVSRLYGKCKKKGIF